MSSRPVLHAFVALALAVALGGCGDDSGATAPAPENGDPSRTAAPDGRVSAAAATSSPFADLRGDTLIAPPAPTLELEGRPGALRFRWSVAVPGTRTVRLLEHDRADDRERVVADLRPARRTVDLPVAPHRLRGDALSWRIEHCDRNDDCVSSRRRTASGLVAATFTPVVPGVAVTGERFGERVALNANGSLLAVARPVEGRVELRFPRAGTVVPGDALARLDGGTSTTRALDVALSASGDTLALLSGDVANGRAPRVVVFERLGEGWLRSADFPAFTGAVPGIGTGAARPHVRLSADGERLLAGCTGAGDCEPAVHAADGAAWRLVARLASVSPGRVTRAIAASDSLARIALVTGDADGRASAAPRLVVHDAGANWRPGPPIALPAFAGDAPLVAALDATGERLVLGGLESSRDPSPVPVLWRHRLVSADGATSLDTEGSRRLSGPSGERVRALSLAADAALDTIAFGWRTNHEAALVTLVRRAGTEATALHLPDAAGHFAKRRFGGGLALAADGSTLALEVPDAPSDGMTGPMRLRAGRVLLMRANPPASPDQDGGGRSGSRSEDPTGGAAGALTASAGG